MNNPNLLIFGVAAVPAIIGLVQVAKQSGLPSRFGALLAVALGLAVGVAESLTTPVEVPLVNGIFLGVALGLSASGLYAGAIAVINPEPPPPVK